MAMNLAGTLSVEEVAAILGKSGQSVRRMCQRGELDAELVITPKGKEWRIRLDDAERRELQQVSNGVERSPGLLELAQVLREVHNSQQQLSTTVAQLSEERGRLLAENAMLRERLAQQERQQVLPAPRKWWRWW